MAPFILVISLVASGLPTSLNDVEPWINSRTDQQIWESLEQADPNHTSSIRALDLTLKRFRSRDQFYLLKKWSGHFEQVHEGTALGLHASAWRTWMLPERLRTGDDLRRLEGRLERENHEDVWGEMTKSFPNDVSGILAARLLIASSDGIPESLNTIRSASPESGVTAFLFLTDGVEFAKHQDWEGAVDAWLEGIDGYPIDWEMADWVERIKNGLLSSGSSVQARIIQDGAMESLRSLRQYRIAITTAQEGDEKAAAGQLKGLIDDPNTTTELRDLCHAQLVLYEKSAATASPNRKVLQALGSAPDRDVQSHLSKLDSSPPSRSLANDLISVASHRSDQGDVRGAIAIWEYLVDRFPTESVIAAKAYGRQVRAHWTRLEAIREIRAAFLDEEITSFFTPLEASQELKALRELGKVLDQSEISAASSTYSEPLLNLMASLYRIHADLGHPERPRNLFLHHSYRVSTETRSALARQAQSFRPEEAIAILQIDDGSSETTLSSEQNQALLSLHEEKEQYKEAAAVARAIAEEASGTPYAKEAWYKTAWLEYKAADYPSSKRTLEDLLPQQEAGTVQHTQTTRLLGLSNYHTGDYAEARAQFDSSLDSGLLEKRDQEEISLLYAYSYLYRQEYSDARARLQSILADNPSRLMKRRVNRLIQQLGSAN